jgi:ornithine carbamoyltransferase
MDRSKHLLRLRDWDSERILETIRIAIRLKNEIKEGKPSNRFAGKTIGLFFEKPSLRTVTSFQVGMHQLGGMPLTLDPKSIGINKRESLMDIARCFSRWLNGLVVRCFEQRLIEQLAEYGSIPIVNALSDDYHPCQALAFGQTMVELYGEDGLRGKNVVFVGDGNNVANSLMELCAKLGMNFTLACPSGFEQKVDEVELALPEFEKHGSKYKLFHNPKGAVIEADILYGDVWVSMGQEWQRDSKLSHFLPFQINKELLDLAPQHCKVTHCMPANRGEEITDEIMDNMNINLCYEEAENRLHVQKAVLWQLLH